LPEAPHAEVPLPHVDVVEEDDTAFARLRQPGREVVLDGLVSMVAVDVQEVDAAVRKIALRFVKRTLNEAREPPVQGVVMGPEFFEHLGNVMARMRVALPAIYGETARVQAEVQDGLAEGTIRGPRVRTQLHKRSRAKHIHEVHRER